MLKGVVVTPNIITAHCLRVYYPSNRHLHKHTDTVQTARQPLYILLLNANVHTDTDQTIATVTQTRRLLLKGYV